MLNLAPRNNKNDNLNFSVMNNDQKKQELVEFLNGLHFTSLVGFTYYLDNFDFEDSTNFSDIENYLNDNGAFNIEIIYYGSAMDFLKENDPSLKDSLELANYFGFTLENLNSEVLASLLASDMVRNEFSEYEEKINDFIESLND